MAIFRKYQNIKGISISNLNNGIYFVQIITDDERKVVKLVKE